MLHQVYLFTSCKDSFIVCRTIWLNHPVCVYIASRAA